MSRVLVDISRPVSAQTPVYEGDPQVQLTRVSHLVAKDPNSWNASLLSLGTHSGTHVDAPEHFCDGAPTVDRITLDQLCGPCDVLDLRGQVEITPEHLDTENVRVAQRLLLRTDGSSMWDQGFSRDYPHLTPKAAAWLRRETTVKLVGIDTWSIEGWNSPGFPVHKTLLCEHPAFVIVEGLDLHAIEEGSYELWVLPLLLKGADAAPARALLAPRNPER